MKKITFSVVGSGRLGTCLARALVRTAFQLESLYSLHRKSAEESRQIIGAGRVRSSLTEAVAQGEIILLTVKDDYLAEVISRLSSLSLDWASKYVFHTSGLYSSTILKELQEKGATTGALHPLQSFPRKDLPPEIFHQIFFVFDGSEKALSLAKQIAESLGGQLITLPPHQRPLYHTACSLASNYLVGLIYASSSLLQEAGLNQRESVALLRPLICQTINNIQEMGIEESLTGPLQRGDLKTMAQQLAALKDFPSVKRSFISLSYLLLEIAEKKRVLSPPKIAHIKHLLEEK